MDFLEINKEIKKKELMGVEVEKVSVKDATESLKLQLDLDPLIKQASSHKITCQEEAKQALAMSMQARKLKKTLEESRASIVRPHIDFQKAINQIVKDYTEKLDSIEKGLKLSLEMWVEAQNAISDHAPELILSVVDGTAKQAVELDFTIEDIGKVPREFLIVDEKLVKKAIKAGIREIEGIKIFEKKTIKMRTKRERTKD